MLRKRLRQEEQPQRLLPMSILERHVFPFAFESLTQALNVLLVCRHTLALQETREFWAPFLSRVMKARLAWMRRRGFVALAHTMERVYQLFPSSMNVMETVKSKFFFDVCPQDFPYALAVPVQQQHFWAISKTVFRASSFEENEKRSVTGYRCAEYREASPSWCYRGMYLQRLCVYTASEGLFSTWNCREHLAVFPSLVSVAGWRSSFQPCWYRLGPWTIAGPAQTTDTGERTPVFQFTGQFSLAAEKPKFLASTGKGRLVLDGAEQGLFRCFNLGETPVPDWEAHTLGFESVADPRICFVLNFRTGMLQRKAPDYRLLLKARQALEQLALDGRKEREEGDEGAGAKDSPRSNNSNAPLGADRKRERGGGKGGSRRRGSVGPRRKKRTPSQNGALIIAEYDYSNLGRAAYVCRRPEGVFTADDLADRFGDYGVDQVMVFDLRHHIPPEVAVIVGRRKRGGRDEYRVRWQGYGEYYDTWEPVDHLGTHAAEVREQFAPSSVATDDEDDKS